MSYVCQIPWCPRPAVWPEGAPQLCVPCRRANRSGVFYSPLLFYAGPWVMARHHQRLNHGVPRTHHQYIAWTVDELWKELIDGGCLAEFLEVLAKRSMRIPQDEFRAIEEYREKDAKGQKRSISTFWCMIDPSKTAKTRILLVTDSPAMAQVSPNAGPLGILWIVRNMQVEKTKAKGGKFSRETLVLRRPWGDLFEKRLRITSDQRSDIDKGRLVRDLD